MGSILSDWSQTIIEQLSVPRIFANVLLTGVFVVLLFVGGGCEGEQTGSQVTRMVNEQGGPHAAPTHASYASLVCRPLRVTPRGPTAQGRTFLEQLCQADQEGIRPSGYALDSLAQELQELYQSPAQDVETVKQDVARLDVALSEAFVRYVDDLLHGSVRPDEVGGKWEIEPDEVDLLAVMNSAVSDGVEGTLDTLVTQNYRYAPLRQALDRYQTIADEGGWPSVGGDGPLQSGDSGPEVGRLRERLAATGDLSGEQADESTYTAAVVEAVQRFEERHGLPVNGEVTAEDREALNVTAKERARRLALNLERYRWMPDDLGREHVFVNLMDFRLETYRNGSRVLSMPIVVGEQGWETVAFADTLEYAMFGPAWNVPSSIATEDLFSQLKGNPSLLEERGYQILTSRGDSVGVDSLSKEALESGEMRIRQEPGPQNPLGRVKYMFPNEHAIYLHDTPADQVFDQRVRTSSHGCIRVGEPVEFGAFLFDEDQLSGEEIQSLMQTADEQRVDLRDPMPVYIVYLTAWVTPEGTVHFRQDRYGYDASLQDALEPPGAAAEACSIIQKVFEEVVVTDGEEA
jgi:murein L,D-transpeptidase YcbB/YkuD